jgi:hypothetical protein
MKYLYYITYPNGPSVKSDCSQFAIIAESEETAIDKSQKYGVDGHIVGTYKLNGGW